MSAEEQTAYDRADFADRLSVLLGNLPIQDPITEAVWLQRTAQRLARALQIHGRPPQGEERVAVRRAIAQTDLWLQAPRREVS